MQMSASSPAAQAANCAGWTIPQNYRLVHECLMELRLPPYEDYGKVTLGDVLRKYWLWLLGTFVLITLIVIFVVRTSYLKKRLAHSIIAKEERERLMSAIEQAAEAVVITDDKAIIQYVNPAFERITGYTYDDAIGQNPRILKSGKHDYAFYRELWDTLTQGKAWTGRFENRKKDGMLYTEEATISPVRDTSGKTINYVAVKRDITEEIKLEEQFRQAQKMESIGRLAGGVAHDFNNMLGVILGYTELVIEQVDPSQSLYASLMEIRTAATRSVEVTRQLLAFARKQTAAPRVLDLNDTMERMLKMLRCLIGEDINLTWLPGAEVWPVKVDPSQIDQILANLCVNARDAIEGVGKIVIETGIITFDEIYCVNHSGFTPGEYVLLAVSDDGCGMDKNTLENIFEPFYTTKEVGKGTGLGLATVYGIVKQNNGFINVYSELDLGTTFNIYLPRHVVRESQIQKKTSEKPSLLGNETILLVEDEPALLGMIATMLDHQGYTILSTSTPGEAIRMAKESIVQLHLLITDVVMPEMNGRELAKNILTYCPDIKCLFMSGYTANVIAQNEVLNEGVHFVQKPFSKRDLAAKVREVLDNE
ncbi:MAG: PAS domain S-box protein [Candidatus Cloacimonetes bacterium]|nr:PAS domain S-box protein [Candidatus Cloacimonadota bacterium]